MQFSSLFQATLLALAMAAGTQAQAAIIYSGENRNVTYDESNFMFTVSLFNDPGTWDDMSLSLEILEDPSDQNQYSLSTLLRIQGNYVEFAGGNDPAYVKNFTSGSTIDAASTYSGDTYLDFSNYTQIFNPFNDIIDNGEFRNTTGYAGMRLTNGADVYYGWIQVSVTNYNNFNLTGTFIDWAYENSPGVGIQAGAIPEPSTAALLLAGAITGLTILRRKKR